MTSFFASVPQNVARNPIARAVAHSAMRKALRTFATQLYLLEDGTEQADNLMAAAQVMAVGMHIAPAHSPCWEAMREAQDLIVARSDDGFRWRAADAADIDIGMTAAMEVIGVAPACAVQAAWVKVRQ